MIAEKIISAIITEAERRMHSGPLSSAKVLAIYAFVANTKKISSVIVSCLDGDLSAEQMTNKMVDKIIEQC